ncbi:protein KTI12/L-seryl-tRNA(Sec) kinase [Kipferlia bialata]|uniref:Protein KTI12/L-seryl-tRNA(Sec) kinase n=1 Tax=Kipferlia bialata TaxID=797122 RepID=A0A9K3CN47_9EUKA|nr:protein KTI12/L-seryl-tRNA(Sec) kinase [Kipferlia bialata]|eukprot:g895.t1
MDSEALDEAARDKENLQPLDGGRQLKRVGLALAPAEETRDTRKQSVKSFRKQLANPSLEDPLEVWREYLLFLQQSKKEEDLGSESRLRTTLRTEVHRALSQDVTVIIDALNYLKSFRYELFCLSRDVPTPYLHVRCEVTREEALARNAVSGLYTEEQIFRLCACYEPPLAKSSWELPCFPLGASDPTPVSDILAICKGSKAVRSSASRRLPLGSNMVGIGLITAVTGDVVAALVEALAVLNAGDSVGVGYGVTWLVPPGLSVNSLQSLRQEFLLVARSRADVGATDVARAFVSYLTQRCR